MRLVGFPDWVENGKQIYVNPDHVVYLYEQDDETYIVTSNTAQDEMGIKVLMPIEEVCGRLEMGNRIYELGRELVEKAGSSKDGDST